MSKEDQKKPMDEQETSSQEGRQGWQRYVKKKWFYPALYLGLAAIILATIMIVQNVNNTTEEQPNSELQGEAGGQPWLEDGEAIPVSADRSQLGWPVARGIDVQMIMGFYVASQEQPAAAQEGNVAAPNIVKYANGYYPHNGVDLARADGESFDVVAAQAGKVVRAEQDVLAGYVVEIQHTDQLKTVYQSLQNLLVKEGDEIQAGALLGQAGSNLFEKELGNHLHFEVMQDDTFANAEEILSKFWKKENKEEKQQDEQRDQDQDTPEQEPASQLEPENQQNQQDNEKEQTE